MNIKIEYLLGRYAVTNPKNQDQSQQRAKQLIQYMRLKHKKLDMEWQDMEFWVVEISESRNSINTEYTKTRNVQECGNYEEKTSFWSVKISNVDCISGICSNWNCWTVVVTFANFCLSVFRIFRNFSFPYFCFSVFDFPTKKTPYFDM